MNKLILLLFFLICFFSLSSREQNTVHVSIDTLKTYTEETSLKEAKANLLAFARQCALEKAIPSNLSLTSLVTDMYVEKGSQFDEATARSIFMLSSMAGLFLNEKKDYSTPLFKGDHYILKISYKTEIKPVTSERDPALYLDLDLSETLLQDGEEFNISVKPSQNGYLYLFNFLADNSVVLFFPTIQFKDNFLKRNCTKIFPAEARADKNSKKAFTIETIYAVFSKTPIAGWEKFKINADSAQISFSGGEESFTLFQQWLSRTNPSNYDEKMAQIHIRNKTK